MSEWSRGQRDSQTHAEENTIDHYKVHGGLDFVILNL